MGKKNKRKQNKQSLIEPTKCVKCEQKTYITICGFCPNCFDNKSEVK